MVGLIYCLYWWDLDITYVGQTSIKLEKRLQQHEYLLKKGEHYNKRVQEAYNTSKDYSILVLDSCTIEELDTLEMYWIDVLNSTNAITGSNKTYGGGSAGKGTLHARSKYSKTLILKIFSLLLKEYSVRQVLERLPKASQHLVYDVKNGNGHRWLKEEYPLEYSVLESNDFKNKTRARGVTLISTRDAYPDFIDTDGNVYSNIRNLRDFCRSHPKLSNLDSKMVASDLSKVLRGIRNSTRGFSLLRNKKGAIASQ